MANEVWFRLRLKSWFPVNVWKSVSSARGSGGPAGGIRSSDVGCLNPCFWNSVEIWKVGGGGVTCSSGCFAKSTDSRFGDCRGFRKSISPWKCFLELSSWNRSLVLPFWKLNWFLVMSSWKLSWFRCPCFWKWSLDLSLWNWPPVFIWLLLNVALVPWSWVNVWVKLSSWNCSEVVSNGGLKLGSSAKSAWNPSFGLGFCCGIAWSSATKSVPGKCSGLEEVSRDSGVVRGGKLNEYPCTWQEQHVGTWKQATEMTVRFGAQL